MKQLKQWIKTLKAPIPTLCYAVAILAYLLSCLLGLAADGVGKLSGSFVPFALQASDFEMVGLAQESETSWGTLDGDPQMIWYNTEGKTVRTLRFCPQYDIAPREICLYYATKEGQGFGVNKRVFPTQQDDGSYLFTLPRGNITALRLDPSSPVDGKMVTMTLTDGFACNETTAFWQNIWPGWNGLYQLVVYPGLAAAIVSTLRQFWLWWAGRKVR